MERDAFLARPSGATAAAGLRRDHPPTAGGPARRGGGRLPPSPRRLSSAAFTPRRHGARRRGAAGGPRRRGRLPRRGSRRPRDGSAVVEPGPGDRLGWRRTWRRGGSRCRWDGPASAARVDLGVTGAVFAIAATGSIVVAAGRAGGRGASLLPPVHAALVREEALLETPGRPVAAHGACFPEGMPSQVVVITGPSRTGGHRAGAGARRARPRPPVGGPAGEPATREAPGGRPGASRTRAPGGGSGARVPANTCQASSDLAVRLRNT